MITIHVQVAVAAWQGIEHHIEQTFSFETKVDGTQSLEAAQQEPCTQQQDQRKSDLRDGEPLAQPAGSASQAPGVLLQYRSRVFACATPGWRNAKKNSGNDCCQSGDGEHAEIRSQVERDGYHVFLCHESHKQAAPPVGECQP